VGKKETGGKRQGRGEGKHLGGRGWGSGVLGEELQVEHVEKGGVPGVKRDARFGRGQL